MSIERVDKFDLMKLTNGLEQEIIEFKDNLSEFELAYATDTGRLFIKDEQGLIKDLTPDSVLKEDQWRITAKLIGNTETATDFNTILEQGHYRSSMSANLWINSPWGESEGAFTLRVFGIRENTSEYLTQELQTISGETFTRSKKANVWDDWRQVFDSTNCPIYKGKDGWARFANGLVIQWGQFRPSDFDTNVFEISLPIVFSRAYMPVAFSIVPSEQWDLNSVYGYMETAVIRVNKTNITQQQNWVSWLAIGY